MPAAVPSAALFAGAAELVSCFWMGQAAMASTATGKQVLCGGCLQQLQLALKFAVDCCLQLNTLSETLCSLATILTHLVLNPCHETNNEVWYAGHRSLSEPVPGPCTTIVGHN